MRIRPATPADQPAIARIHVEGQRAAYRGILPGEALDVLNPEWWLPRRLEYLAGHGDSLLGWVADDNGTVVAFCDTAPVSEPDLPPGAAEVLLLYVDPSRVAAGIGRALFEHAVADLRARGFGPLVLWTLEGNARARRFYERQGWRADGATHEYRPPGTEGIVATEVRYRLG